MEKKQKINILIFFVFTINTQCSDLIAQDFNSERINYLTSSLKKKGVWHEEIQAKEFIKKNKLLTCREPDSNSIMFALSFINNTLYLNEQNDIMIVINNYIIYSGRFRKSFDTLYIPKTLLNIPLKISLNLFLKTQRYVFDEGDDFPRININDNKIDLIFTLEDDEYKKLYANIYNWHSRY